MSYYKSIFGTTALVCLTSGTTAFADVTAQEVWENMKSLMEGYGDLTVASETVSGDTLAVGGIALKMDLPEGSAESTLGNITFRELGDGTVSIEFPTDYSINMSVAPADEDPVDVVVKMTHTNMSIIASGDTDALVYAFDVPSFGYDVETLVVDGEEIETDLQLNMTNLVGTYEIGGGDLRDSVAKFTSDNAKMTGSFTAPDTDGSMTFDVDINDLVTDSVSVLPADVDFNDMGEVLAKGMTVDSTTRHGEMNYTISVEETGNNTNINGAATSGELKVVMDRKAIEYGGTGEGMSVEVTGDQIPFPQVAFGMQDYNFNLLTPIEKTDTPSDFGLLMRLGGFTISDAIWGIFDPSEVLPRDPATVALDLSGQANWLVDIFDPKFEELPENPGELHALKLNDLQVSVAGAELTGSGDFTFDNSDLESFGGMPKPNGGIDLKLVGANGLLDRLVQIGLLPQEQAMGARMMMGLFATPGEGDDTLTSKIEVDENGSVFANGQQLK